MDEVSFCGVRAPGPDRRIPSYAGYSAQKVTIRCVGKGQSDERNPNGSDEFEGYPGITNENSRGQLLARLDSEEYYAMELTATRKVIGNIYCGIRDYSAREVGYIVNRDYQRRGFGAEALSAVINRALQDGTHRVYAECDPQNTASWKLMEKAEVHQERHFRQNIYFHTDEKGQGYLCVRSAERRTRLSR